MSPCGTIKSAVSEEAADVGVLGEFASSTASQVAAALVIAGLAYLLWRNVDSYQQLRREACTALTMHAPLIVNLSLELSEEGRIVRLEASRDLRAIADRLTNADAPPSWVTRVLGLPSPTDVRQAGRVIRRLSNNLFLPHDPQPADLDAHEPLNREDREEARRLLRCRSEHSR